MEEYTLEKIEQLDDLMEIVDIGNEWGVNMDGLVTFEEFKERLILYKLKETEQQYFRFDDERFNKMRMEQDDKINAIIELYNKARSSLGPYLNTISSILKAGNISEDLGADIESHIEDLQTRECCVVFAGETSSGKSSLLNIVLGVDILPTHALSCTFIICKLKYSETYRSRIIYTDLTSEEHHYNSADEAKDSLNSIIFERKQLNREGPSNIKEVEIYLPAELLKTGITIVDTPGFGENPELNSKVAKFLASSTITGFVYLIRTDSGGGVEEDRLLDFLREIKRLRGRNSVLRISDEAAPSAALFICNRWDIIREDQRESVRANNISKLTDAWPELKKSQIKFFSTESAAKHALVDRNYITKDFANLLNQIVEIIQTALDTRVKQHYRWLKRIVNQTSSYIKSMVSQKDKSDEELEIKFHEADNKIKHLDANAKKTTSRLYQNINVESENLISKIKSYLQSTDIKTNIRQWDLKLAVSQSRRSSVVSLAGSMTSNSQPNSYEVMALRYLVDEIDRWVKANKFDIHMTTTLERTISSKFEALKNEIADINGEMNETSSISSDSSCSTLQEEELFEMLSCVKKARRNKFMSKIEDIAQSFPDCRAILTPKVLVAKAILATMNIPRGGRRVSVQNNDPQMYVKDKAISFLNILVRNENLLHKLCTRYTESLHQFVENIEKSIPKFIASNKKLMYEISLSRKREINDKDTLMQTIEKLDRVRELLKGFECVYVKDLRNDTLKLTSDDTISSLSSSSKKSLQDSLNNNSFSAFVHGVCFFSQLGTLKLPGDELPSSIMSKKSTFDLSEDTVFKETARLRNMKSENVASFLGMVRQDKKAVYIFSGNLHPVSRYLSKPHIHDIKMVRMKIIDGIVNGLTAIHKAELVHMELTPQLVMIDTDIEEVKLIGGCLPQKLSFIHQNHSEKIGYLQYFSQEVLKGELYKSSDDIYSLALTIWKLLFDQNPFHEQDSLDLTTFIETVNPQTMIQINETWPLELKQLFTGCLFNSPADRLKINEVKNYLSKIDLSDIISVEKAPRRRNVVNRSSRSKHKKEGKKTSPDGSD